MANSNLTAELFNHIAHLMLNGKDEERLVPFQRLALSNALRESKPPPLELTTPGLSQVLHFIGAGNFLDDIKDIVHDFLTLRFPGLLGNVGRLIPDFLGFVREQLGLGLSLIALLNEAAGGKDEISKNVHKAYIDYFFNNGFKTLEGGLISPPTAGTAGSVEDVRALAAEFRGLVSRKSADQYVRDLIRVTGEAAGDAFFMLDVRYAILNRPDFPNAQVCRSWFNGFANLAESTVTSAVETVMQGLGAFSTNPLVAASLGTFAGVAARKATQAASLWEFGIDNDGSVTSHQL